MARANYTSPESDLNENSFVLDYFGVSTDTDTLGLGFSDLVEVGPDEAVDWETLEVLAVDDSLEAAHNVRWSRTGA